MTSPIVVGAVAVEVSASAKGFARKLREAVVAEFKDAGLDRVISDALGKKTFKIKIEPVWDEKSLPKTLPAPQRRAPRAPKKPKEPKAPKLPKPDVDPLLKAWQQDVQRQVRALAKQAVKIPVSADTDELRSGVGAALKAIENTLKAEIPVEPEGRREFERQVAALVREVSGQIKASVPVEISKAEAAREARAAAKAAEAAAPPIRLNVDVDHNRIQRALSSLSSRLPQGLQSALSGIGNAANAAGSAVTSSMGAAATALTQLVNPATLATVAIGAVVGGFALLGPAAGAAAGAIGVLGGALASLPAFAAGGAGILGTFALALRGVADRFKETSKAAGGGGASVAAQGRAIAAAQRSIEQAHRGVAAAERALANAQRESQRAQEAVNRARKIAADRIEDLGRALRGAQLDERDADLRIREAQRELAEARRSGNALDVERAALALEQAQLAAENAAEAARDAAEEKAEADRKGVEGSDEVTAALDRQQAAYEQVIAAQDSLKSAQDSLIAANEQLAAANERVGGSAASAAKDMLKLAPAALKFVDAVKSLKQPFEDLRLSVQERFFRGLDKTVAQVGQAWIPQLKTTLGRYADTFNSFFRDLGSSISQPKFISDIAAGMESVRKAGEGVGKAISGPLVDAFGRLSRASAPFVEALGDGIAGLVKDFSAWVKSADESGKLDKFFKTTTGYLKDFFRLGKAVGSTIGSLVKVLFGANEKQESGFIEAFEKLAGWLRDKENQRILGNWIQVALTIGRVILTDIVPALLKLLWAIASIPDAFVKAYLKIEEVGGEIRETIGATVDAARQKFSDFKAGVSSAVDNAKIVVENTVARIRDALGTLGQPLIAARDAFGRFRDGVRERIDGAVSTVRGIPDRIRNALGSAGSILYNAGRAVIQGLIRGIASMVPTLGSYLGALGQFIADHKGPIERDRQLLVPAGRAIMQGLISGIDSQRATLRKELAAVTADVAGGVGTDIAADYAMRLTSSADLFPSVPAPAAAPRAEMSWAPGSTGDPLLDAIRRMVQVRYAGDANLAFGKSSTPQLARG